MSARSRLAGVAAALPARLWAPVDIASLVYFRIAFGAVMVWEILRYFENGWIPRYWIEPAVHFTYYGFGWVRPWPGDGMYWHFAGLEVLAVLIVVGLWYRAAAALFFLGFTYAFLLEEARYLNHFYLICLLSFTMIWLPANRAFAYDALRRPRIRSAVTPAWTLWLLRVQIGIVYFYAGLAKLNGDWLRGQPMEKWLAERTDEVPLIGRTFTEPWAAELFSYGSVAFDLLVVPALLWRRTRVAAFVVALGFHLTNAALFRIGIFPWFMIAATALFFEPDWPRRLVTRVRAARGRGRRAEAPASRPAAPAGGAGALSRGQRATLALLAVYVGLQLLIPLRHFLYPGNVSWTEEGHRFAWHMKLREKVADAVFVITAPASGRRWEIDPESQLPDWQRHEVMARPDMLLEYAHILAAGARRAGYEDAQVRVRSLASLHGRPPQPLVDGRVDLAAQERSLRPARWIVALRHPLPPDSSPRARGRP